MHPDQRTPDSHRYQASDSQTSAVAAPSADTPDARQPDLTPNPSVSDEMATGARVAEAGGAYVGRQLDDALKSSPRVDDRDEAVDEDPTTAQDD